MTPSSTTVAVITETPTVIIPTAVPTEGKTPEIKDVDVYPVPYGKKGNVYFEFTLTKFVNSVELKIYSSAFRLIKKVDVSSACVQGRKKSAVPAKEFGNLANGTYYFILEGESADGFVKSKMEKLIILK